MIPQSTNGIFNGDVSVSHNSMTPPILWQRVHVVLNPCTCIYLSFNVSGSTILSRTEK